ncbi:hypothetical protein ACFPRL_14670 [Pseudoclavibacter helvolus]
MALPLRRRRDVGRDAGGRRDHVRGIPRRSRGARLLKRRGSIEFCQSFESRSTPRPGGRDGNVPHVWCRSAGRTEILRRVRYQADGRAPSRLGG